MARHAPTQFGKDIYTSMTHHEHQHSADTLPEQSADFPPEETTDAASNMPEVSAISENSATTDESANGVSSQDEQAVPDERLPDVASDEAAAYDEAPKKHDFVPDSEAVRLQELNLAIELHPDAAVNYLLRGEWFLEKRQFYIARDDFRQAAQLAETQRDTRLWGVVEQWVLDRALVYLDEVERML